MKHTICIDETYSHKDPGRRYYIARVEREDGATVYNSEPDRSAEVAWEDAARWCKRNGIEFEKEGGQ